VDDSCIFCQVIKGTAPCFAVYEDEHNLAILEINPCTPYHTLVIPKVHSSDILSIAPEDLRSAMGAVRNVMDLYLEKFDFHDFQVLNNCGKYGQQTVWHTHFHIIPRFKDDGNNWHTLRRDDLIAKLPQMLAALKL
jgi:histidine triad (HIT) family protein